MINNAFYSVVLTLAFAATSNLEVAAQRATGRPPIARDSLLVGVEGEGSKKSAKEFFAWGDYKVAVEEYKKLLKEDMNNPQYLYIIGLCYLRSHIDDFHTAIPFLEKAAELPGVEKDINYHLAKAYHLTYQFDKAITFYKKHLEIEKDVYFIDLTKRQIEMCHNAKELVKFPLNVTIKNMGPEVNSAYPDYYPHVDENEAFVAFCSRREKLNGGFIAMDGFKTSDVFIIKDKRGHWTKAKNIGGSISSMFDEEIVGISNNGQYLFLNKDSWETSGDIFYAEKKGRQFMKPVPFNENINTPFIELTAFITDDDQFCFFASNRPDGFGGFDIYKSRKLPTGEWGPAVNLGPTINTKYDEYFPKIMRDDTTLMFCSEGHSSMGGFDIFTSQRTGEMSENGWTDPKNFGAPINTPDNEMEVSFNKSGRLAYFSAWRPGGQGDLDIYEATYSDIDPEYSLLRGRVIAMAPIDYNDYQTFNIYTKDGKTRKFPEEFTPPDKAWKFKETVKLIVKPGYEYKGTVVFDNAGETKRITYDKAKFDNPEYVFKDLIMTEIPMKKYQAPSKRRPTEVDVSVESPTITVTEKESGDLVGNYTAVEGTSSYVIILPAGEYIIEVIADNFEPLNVPIFVKGKSSFRAIINKNLIMQPISELKALHYLTLPIEAITPPPLERQ